MRGRLKNREAALRELRGLLRLVVQRACFAAAGSIGEPDSGLRPLRGSVAIAIGGRDRAAFWAIAAGGVAEAMKVSIIIPVYNEFSTFDQVMERVRRAPLPAGWEKEIVVIDDGSTDGTAQTLGAERHRISHAEKGSAIRAGIGLASGEIILIQDGDLEYDPNDYARLLEPIRSGTADIVYGSRFLGQQVQMQCANLIANRVLTAAANLL